MRQETDRSKWSHVLVCWCQGGERASKVSSLCPPHRCQTHPTQHCWVQVHVLAVAVLPGLVSLVSLIHTHTRTHLDSCVVDSPPAILLCCCWEWRSILRAAGTPKVKPQPAAAVRGSGSSGCNDTHREGRKLSKQCVDTDTPFALVTHCLLLLLCGAVQGHKEHVAAARHSRWVGGASALLLPVAGGCGCWWCC